MKILPIKHHIEFCDHGASCTSCCWNWIAVRAKSGYGRTRARCYGRIETYAHRIVWSFYREKKVPRNHFVTHTCKNKSCCNPHHLELITHVDHYAKLNITRDNGRINEMRNNDMLNGKIWGNAKLTEQQVLSVLKRGKSGRETQKQLAEELGISQPTVSYILRGRTWKHLQGESHAT